MSKHDWPIEIEPVFGCWLWRGELGRDNGRPIVWRGGKPYAAHRAVYQSEVGPVPDGLVLDHLCRRTLCVHWRHLEPVSKEQNEWRKSWAYRCRAIVRCPRGHSMEHALVTPERGRLCRHCHVETRMAPIVEATPYGRDE